jgi:hypothetical protein
LKKIVLTRIDLLIFNILFAEGSSDKMTKPKNSGRKLPVVICECGFKMLIVPDLDEMVHCIQTHAATHGKNESDQEKSETEYCQIEELLTQKVLVSISKEN